jgi:nitric oxide reductase NorE protein
MPTAESTHQTLPGDLAMWFFILAELAVFGLLIVAFSVTESLHAEAFRASRALLDTSTGLTLTLSLLTSGFFAALAVTQVKQQQSRQAALLLLAAVGSALFYVVIKFREYNHLAYAGLDIEYDTFFTLYWILTGFHFLHVLLGLVILGFMAMRAWRGAYTPAHCRNLESGVLYWHMVDLVWVMLFPLVYVLN